MKTFAAAALILGSIALAPALGAQETDAPDASGAPGRAGSGSSVSGGSGAPGPSGRPGQVITPSPPPTPVPPDRRGGATQTSRPLTSVSVVTAVPAEGDPVKSERSSRAIVALAGAGIAGAFALGLWATRRGAT